jgi:hypothetical protein
MATTEGTRTGSAGKPAAAKTTAGRPSPRTAARPPARSGQRAITRRKVTIRHVDPWSVLKLSLIFYFCALLVIMLGISVFWSVVNRLGVIEQALGFLLELNLEVTINAGNIARALFLIGLLNVALLSALNVFLAFLYNLVADLLGGMRVTLAEEEPA